MDEAAMKAFVDAELAKQRKALMQEMRMSDAFNRSLKIEQTKAMFKNPADKRGIGYLIDEEFDWKDFSKALANVSNGKDEMIDVGTNQEKFKEFVEFCITFGNMRERKNSKEIEAYKVANKSQYGWLTEKFYRQGELFEKDVGDKWYEKEELAADKKLALFRGAEREAKYSQQKKSQSAPKRRKPSRWDQPRSDSELSSSSSFFNSGQLRFPPSKPPSNFQSGQQVQCYGCGELGHIRRNCTQKK